MTHDEYQRLREQAEADYRKKLEAIELVWELAQAMSGKAEAEPAPKKAFAATPSGEDTNGSGRGQLIRTIRSILKSFQGKFTFKDVEKALLDHAVRVKKTSLASALRRLTASGVIEVVVQGAGRSPSVYKRASGRTHG